MASSLSQATQLAAASRAEKCWITGGARLYQEGMEIADELVVTYLDLDVGDQVEYAHAPQISSQLWQVDEARSDSDFRPRSGDCRWKLVYYQKVGKPSN